MTIKKENCWEFFKCGREQGGVNAKADGVCPATSQSIFNEFNQGTNSGRACWLVAGTFCNKIAQGTFAQKKKNCMDCEFYKKVHLEEGISTLKTDFADIFGYTHIGNIRKSNEDRYFLRKHGTDSLLIAIADGMGGEVAGDFAAETTTGELSSFGRIEKGKEEESLCKFVKKIDHNIFEMGELDSGLEGMGTTLIILFIRDGVAYWVHVGDSRLFFFRNNKMTPMTEDQNFARFLLEEGEITPEEFQTHPSKNLLDQSLGCGFVEPETGSIKLRKSDLLILTTDGLHDYMLNKEIEILLKKRKHIKDGAKKLVNAALKAGGGDNITIVITEITKTL